jgi:hypothetical protein
MNSVLRGVLGLVGGVAAGLAVVMAGDAWVHSLYPPPAGLAAGDRGALAAHIAAAPQALLAGMVAYWALAVFAAGLLAQWLGRAAWAGWAAAALLAAAVAANLYLVPHPRWMVWAAGAGVAAAALLGLRLGRRLARRR